MQYRIIITRCCLLGVGWDCAVIGVHHATYHVSLISRLPSKRWTARWSSCFDQARGTHMPTSLRGGEGGPAKISAKNSAKNSARNSAKKLREQTPRQTPRKTPRNTPRKTPQQKHAEHPCGNISPRTLREKLRGPKTKPRIRPAKT